MIGEFALMENVAARRAGVTGNVNIGGTMPNAPGHTQVTPADPRSLSHIANWNPNHEHGNQLPVGHGPADYSDLVPDGVVARTLVNDARSILPPGTYFEIRARPATLEGRGVAWYYHPDMQSFRMRNRPRRLWEDGYKLLAWSIA